jgi:hypothetical protein
MEMLLISAVELSLQRLSNELPTYALLKNHKIQHVIRLVIS